MKCNLRRHSERRFCCGGCGRAFSSMAPFDWHRTTDGCRDPREAKRFVAHLREGAVGDVEVWGSEAGEWTW